MASGGVEEAVGEAMRSCRARIFLVSKVCPHSRRERCAQAAIVAARG